MINITLLRNSVTKILFVCSLILTIASCDRKSCNDVTCPIGQVCNNGQCYCPDGYEGTNCDVESYQKYIRNYNFVSESCNPNTPFSTSNVFIQLGSRINEIHIYNLMGSYCTYVAARIYTDNSNQGNILEIPQQSMNCSGNTVSGQGTFDPVNNRVNLQLYYTFQGISYQCNTILQ